MDLEVLGYATHHDEPMLFPTRKEAAAYCDNDEEPMALTRLSEASARIASLEADRDSWAQQASDRVDDAVRFAQERDALEKRSNAQALLIRSLEEQRNHLRADQEAAREARATLESERAANAILTAENEALRADARRYQAFFDNGPVCFMGETFRSKAECDAAIDLLAAQGGKA